MVDLPDTMPAFGLGGLNDTAEDAPLPTSRPDDTPLPTRQIEFLQALVLGKPVAKNAATRMALRHHGYITTDDDWDAVQITEPGRKWLIRNNHMPESPNAERPPDPDLTATAALIADLRVRLKHAEATIAALQAAREEQPDRPPRLEVRIETDINSITYEKYLNDGWTAATVGFTSVGDHIHTNVVFTRPAAAAPLAGDHFPRQRVQAFGPTITITPASIPTSPPPRIHTPYEGEKGEVSDFTRAVLRRRDISADEKNALLTGHLFDRAAVRYESSVGTRHAVSFSARPTVAQDVQS